MDDQNFRDLMSGVCAPVAVVTALGPAGPYGATVSSLASVSLRPALLSIALDRRSQLLSLIRDTARFGVNVLSAGQGAAAQLFATRDADRFGQTAWHLSQGLPRLTGAPGWAACDLLHAYPGGDHLLLVGAVTDASSVPHPPLIYAHRTYGTHSGLRLRRPLLDSIAACAH